MATVANQYNPNDPNANANQGGGGTVMPSASGGGSAGGASAPQSSATPYQPPNVSQYLAANQGAGSKLATGITNNVQGQANQLGNQVNTAQNQANSQYQPLNSNLSQGQNVAQTAFQNPQALLDSYNAAKTASSSQPLTSDQQNQAAQYNQFQQLNSGGYNQGIQNYGNYAQQQQNALQGQLANITQQTGAANNEMGRNQLLQNTVGQGNYNQGEQTLDNLFLQGSPGQRNANGLSNLQQLQQNLGQIGTQAQGQVGAFGNDTQSKLAALQGLSAGDQSGIKNLFNTGSWNGQAPAAGAPLGLQGIAGNVQNEYDQLSKAVPQQQALLAAASNNQNLTGDQLAQLGLTAGTHTYGINDLSPYLTSQNLNAYNAGGAAQAASADEFARYNALNQLAGGPAGAAQPSIFGSSASAGGYTPIAFDTNKFNTDLTNKQNTLNSDWTTKMTGALANFGAAPITGGSGGFTGGFSTPQGGQASAGLINSLAQGLANKNITPEQANQMITSWEQQNAGNGSINDFKQAISPITDYYNNVYSPAMGTELGVATPTQMPGFKTVTGPQIR